MTNGFLKKLRGAALDAEKKKDFRNVVILQFLIIGSALLLNDILRMSGMGEEASFIFRDIFFLALGGLYVLILWDMLKNFTENKILIVALFVFIMGTYVLALVTVNPIWKIFDEEQQRPYLFFIHFVLFTVEATVIVFAIFDIFAGNKMSQEKLWGSACIYLMIAISFGSVYDLINIANPGSMGEPLKLGLDSYTACIAYSMTILGGQDPAFPNATPLIANLGIMEAVWGNLFIVLLVGRLLGQPDAEVKDEA
jgi:hypothetical protein